MKDRRANGAARRRSWLRMHVGDARQLDSLLPARQCLDVTITSPPYGPTIDYGDPKQMGHGQSYSAFLADMKRVLEVLHARTRDSGSLWLIVDSFKERIGGMSRLVPLPFDLAQSAEECGWVLQDVIIWQKDHTLPWSGQGRLRNSFEYVLMLVKGGGFKYRLDRIRDSSALQEWWHRYPERYSPAGAAPTNVWYFPIPRQGSWGNGVVEHRCPLPEGLVARIVELTTDPDDVVCDPFAGVGTVIAVAEALGRRGVGVELISDHAEQFYASVLPETVARLRQRTSNGRLRFARRVAHLRHAKLARMLVKGLANRAIPVAAATSRASVRLPTRAQPYSVGKQQINLYVPDGIDEAAAAQAGRELLTRRPLSKFGIEAAVEVRPLTRWKPPLRGRWTRVSLIGTRYTPFDNHVIPNDADPVVLINFGVESLSDESPVRAASPPPQVADEEAVNR